MSVGTVVLDLPAHMECSEDGCLARLTVDLILSLTGGFVFRPPKGHGWQLGTAPAAPVYECRCPLHHAKVTRLVTPGLADGVGEAIAKANGVN